MSFARKCADLGLDPKRIKLHQERIRAAILERNEPKYPVLDTCRPDNGGVLNPAKFSLSNKTEGFVAFVPAAGASTRFYAPFSAIAAAPTDLDNVALQLRKLGESGAQKWPLPSNLRELISAFTKTGKIDKAVLSLALKEIEAPKGLLPCVKEGTTFLELKTMEHNAMSGLQGEVFIASKAAEENFNKALAQVSQKNGRSYQVLVQGAEQSTIRFNERGEPYEESDGRFSLVPGGHGTLISLFPQVRKLFPQAKSVFIRNIDNVTGISPEACKATDTFLSTHSYLLECMRKIRQSLDGNRVSEAAKVAEGLLAICPDVPLTAETERFLRACPEAKESTLWQVQCRLFHFQPKLMGRPLAGERERLDLLASLYRRPLNCFGQVPNGGGDVGGSPLFCQTALGELKICLELPHVSADDRKKFLENIKLSTHFNPVFVAAELDFAPGHYDDSRLPFWILSEKKFRGAKVFYHETILYELLGNNLLANLVFLEIPRLLFNPHKSVLDLKERALSDWL